MQVIKLFFLVYFMGLVLVVYNNPAW